MFAECADVVGTSPSYGQGRVQFSPLHTDGFSFVTMADMEVISKSTADTKKIAKEFVERLIARGAGKEHATVVALLGELGAGKTTFVQHMGEAFGIPDLMQSPTFVIERRYPLAIPPFETLIHVDAYRLEDPRELTVLDFENDLRTPSNLIVIEWANKVRSLLPGDTITITFSHGGMETRGIHIEESL